MRIVSTDRVCVPSRTVTTSAMVSRPREARLRQHRARLAAHRLGLRAVTE